MGGITGATLGANDTVVAACDTDGIGVGYTTAYNAGTSAYNTTAVNLTGVDPACNGLAFSVTVGDAKTDPSASLNTTTGTLVVALNAATLTLSAPVSAEAIESLAIVISG